MNKKVILAAVFLCALCSQCVAATYTTTGAGNWNDPTKWDVGGTVPGNGDTAVIKHAIAVTSNVTVGTSGAAGTIAITIDAVGDSGALTVDSGVTLTVRGDTLIDNAAFTLGSGSGNAHYVFGNGGSAQQYVIRISSTISQTSSRLISAGTSGARNTFTKETSAGNGRIAYFENGSAYGGITAEFTDFYDMGNPSIGAGQAAIRTRLSGASQEFHFGHCTFTRTSCLELLGCPADRNMYLRYIKIVDPLLAPGISTRMWSLATTAPTTGERIFRNIGGGRSCVNVGQSASQGGWDVQRVAIGNIVEAGITSAVPYATFKEVFVATPYNLLGSLGVMGTTYKDVICFTSTDVQCGTPIECGGQAGTGTITYDGWMLQQTFKDEEPDAFGADDYNAGGPWTYHIKNCISCLPNGRMLNSFNGLSLHGSSKTNVILEHNTAAVQDSLLPTPRGYSAFGYTVTYAGHANVIAGCYSNLCAANAPTTTYGYGLFYYPFSAENVVGSQLIGTAANTSTTTQITCTGKAWSTLAGYRIQDSGAKVYITGAGAGDPAVGENSTITASTANTITFSPALSLPPDSGSATFAIIVKDTITAANAHHNAWFNARNGTVYDETGQNGISKMGYHAMPITNRTTIGANDINLGSGTDWQANGPKYYDPTRGIHNFSNRYLGPAGLATTPPNWAPSTAYVVGDRVKNSDAAWYANEVLWYRCKLAHTSGADGSTTEPGVGATWNSRWEFDIVEIVDEASYQDYTITDPAYGLTSASYQAAILAWVRKGWAPRNPALQFAAADGTTPGAVEGIFSGGALLFLKSRFMMRAGLQK